MAGETSTRSTATAQAHSSLIDLDGTDDGGEVQGGTADDSVALKAELEEIKKQNERYKQQVHGWESQSRKNLEESKAYAERLARLEGRLEGRMGGDAEKSAKVDGIAPGKLKSALRKWLDNDDSELDEVERYLSTASQPRQSVKDTDVEEVVARTLQKYGTKSTLQSLIGKTHKEMSDAQSPLYRAVFEQYDDYIADPGNQLFFPADEKFLVPAPTPEGRERMVDARVIRQLAAEIKAQGGFETGVNEGRRQEARAASTGTVQGGRSSATRGRNVEAIDLLTSGERDEMANLKAAKAWPKSWPTDEKAAAKFLFEGFTADEKARRIAEYRKSRG
jgi:hypothetical protein